MFENILKFQAGAFPEAAAIITRDRAISYRTFYGRVQRIAARLADVVEPGAVAVIVCDRFHEHLAVRAALHQLGAVTASVLAWNAQKGLIKADLTIWGKRGEAPPPGAIVFTDDWWTGPAPAEPVLPRRAPKPDDPVHITISSGTTGTPKQILITREMMDGRLFSVASSIGIGARARILNMFGLDTVGGAILTLAAWLVGGAAMLGFETLADQTRPRRLRPTLVLGSPLHLAGLLSALPRDFQPTPWVTIGTGGSSMPEDIATALRERVSEDLLIGYGSTETLGISAGRPGAEGEAGYVQPWAQARIIDEKGRDLPPGEIGELLVKTPFMTTSYLDDEKQTRQAFLDGWFRPGDLGSLSADGLLTITGRLGEMINRGGIKMAYFTIEEAARACGGVVDAGACEMRGARGLPEPWVGVVAPNGFDSAELDKCLSERCQRLKIRYVALAEVPRNAMGKIVRASLVEAVEAAREAESTPS